MRGLASKFVHLFISTLHFPNQVLCSLWLSCSKVPSCNSLILLLESLLIIISYFKGRGIRLQRSTAVLDNRQRHCLPTQYFYFWWGMTSIYWKCSPAVEERLLGRQNALWCARCCEAVPRSLRRYWWCWLQVHFYDDQLKSTGQIPRWELILNQEEHLHLLEQHWGQGDHRRSSFNLARGEAQGRNIVCSGEQSCSSEQSCSNGIAPLKIPVSAWTTDSSWCFQRGRRSPVQQGDRAQPCWRLCPFPSPGAHPCEDLCAQWTSKKRLGGSVGGWIFPMTELEQ